MRPKDFLQLIRIGDWTKNVFVLLPAFFGGRLALLWQDWPLAVTFSGFCFLSGAVYSINDYCDLEADRAHPLKKERPLAAGNIQPKQALLIAAVFSIAGLALGFTAGIFTGLVFLVYFTLNVAYSLFLKRIPLLDVLLVASGFILRILAGGFATGIVISHWLLLVAFFLALGLVLSKRYDDLQLMRRGVSQEIRSAASGYNLRTTGIALVVIFVITAGFYTLYTFTPEVRTRLHSDFVFLTALPVFAGMARYLFLALVRHRSGSPIDLLRKDFFLAASVVAWMGLFAYFLYY